MLRKLQEASNFEYETTYAVTHHHLQSCMQDRHFQRSTRPFFQLSDVYSKQNSHSLAAKKFKDISTIFKTFFHFIPKL